MNAKLFFTLGLAAAACAGAHQYASHDDHLEREDRGARVWTDVRPEHRAVERGRDFRADDRREAWRHQEWRENGRNDWREERRHDWRAEECRRPAQVIVVEHRRNWDPVPVEEFVPEQPRASVSINW